MADKTSKTLGNIQPVGHLLRSGFILLVMVVTAMPGVARSSDDATTEAFLRCFHHEKHKRHLEAAECFVKFEGTHPASDSAPKALFYAATNYFKAQRTEDELKTLRRLSATYGGKSELASKALYMIGESHSALARYLEAAQAFELFVKKHPKHALAEEALSHAALCREVLGHYEPAVKNLEIYLRLFGTGSRRAAQVGLNIVSIRQKQKLPKRVIGAAKQHLKSFGTAQPAKVRPASAGCSG